jgi:hypothetical protein
MGLNSDHFTHSQVPFRGFRGKLKNNIQAFIGFEKQIIIA